MLPVSIVADVLVAHPARSWSDLELKAAVHERMTAPAAHARLYIPGEDQDYAFGVGLRMTLRHIVREEEGLYRVADDEEPILS